MAASGKEKTGSWRVASTGPQRRNILPDVNVGSRAGILGTDFAVRVAKYTEGLVVECGSVADKWYSIWGG